MIFGILNVGFGLFGLLSLMVMSVVLPKLSTTGNPILQQLAQSSQNSTWTKISTPFDAISFVVLMVAGVGLLLLKNWSRGLSIGYSVYAILSAVVGCVVTLAAGGIPQVLIGTVFGALISLIYPILLIVFMRRPTIVAACQPLVPAP